MWRLINCAVDAITRILLGEKKFHVLFFLFSFHKVAEMQKKKTKTYFDISSRGYDGPSYTLNSIFLCVGRRRTPSFPPRRILWSLF